MAQSALLTIMINAARKAGRSLTRDFGEVENLQVSRKGPADFVSNADMRAEQIVYEELKKARPTYSFLMEESGEEKGEDGQHRWIIDPLDGTTNFLHSIPLFCTAIALERGDEIVASVIYNPITEEFFTAERGRGAFGNNRRMRVAGRRHLADCVGVTGIKNTEPARDAKDIRSVAHLNAMMSGIRRTGSASIDMAWLAAGRFDVMWETGLQPWDIAPGLLMIKEAGGIVTDYRGRLDTVRSGEVVAGNEYAQAALLKELKTLA
ncbi:inositol monophosphatase family protein [Cucumibacter marinus]|uniref:inositol monophosphatase family protein n=1 Tax=Cucumibacter marinus TaxID=1121252 RepID=UPI000418CAF9|nr:inositol monophosphatase family protein [Cucumibacter marinus]